MSAKNAARAARAAKPATKQSVAVEEALNAVEETPIKEAEERKKLT